MTKLMKTKGRSSLLLEERLPSSVTYRFGSILDMAEWLREVGRPDYLSHGPMRESFCNQTWDQAMHNAEHGDPVRSDMFSGKLERLTLMLENESPHLIHDVSGEILDIGAYVSGEQECFLRRGKRKERRCVSITVDTSFICRTRQSIIENRAAAIVALIDELQMTGNAVDFHVQHKCGGLERSDLLIDVEMQCRPVDIGAVAFVCSAAFLRRFVFATLEHYCNKNRPGHGGYGRGIPLDMPEDPGFLFVGSFCKDFKDQHWMTLESSKDHILDMLARWQESPDKVILG